MRIRTTRPVFWRSKTIAQFDWPTRLVLKGVESYVDDNGVGKDSVPIICADVFPYDISRDPRETLATVSRALQTLCDAGLVARYETDGEALIYIRRWKSLQKIDKPNPGRYPRPDGTLDYKDDVDEDICAAHAYQPPLFDEAFTEPFANNSRSSRGVPAVVVEEERSRGKEQEPPYPPSRESPTTERLPARTNNGAEIARSRITNLSSRSLDAYRIAETFSASLPVPIENELLSGIGTQIDKCLKRGIPPPAIAAGLHAWTESDSWSPTQIPNFVHKANNRRGTTTGKPTTKALGYEQALTELLTEVTTL